MPTASLADVVTDVRARTGVTTGALSDARLNAIVEQSAGKFYDMLVGADEERYVTIEQKTVSSGDTIDITTLSSVLYRLTLLEKQDGSEWTVVPRFTLRSRDRSATRELDVPGVTYRLVGNYLRLEPSGSATGAYRIWYIPAYGTAAATGFTYPSNWWECVVCDVCAVVAAIQEVSPSPWIALREDARQGLLAAIRRRDGAGPERMTMTRSSSWDE